MDVFVSYSSKDEAIANELYQLLEQNGISPWIAVADAAHGKSYAASIIEAINHAPVMLLVLSQAAVDSPHVLNEVNYAFNHGKTILPVVVGQVTLTDGLEYYLGAQNLLTYSSSEEFYSQLLTTVNQALNKGQGEPRPLVITGGTYQPPKKRFPWPILLLMAVVGLLVGALMAVLPYLNPAADPAPGGNTSVTTPTSDTTEPSESATTPTESTPDPTAPSQNTANDLSGLPAALREAAANFDSQDATTKNLYTLNLSVGETYPLNTTYNVSPYTSNPAVAKLVGMQVVANAPGEAYIVLASRDGTTARGVYKVIVTESAPSSTTPTESTPAPTASSQALDLDAIPEPFRGQVKNGISTGTVSIKVGESDLPYIWTGMSIDLYTANKAIASTDEGVIYGVSVGETYVVITHKGSLNGFAYKVIVTE